MKKNTRKCISTVVLGTFLAMPSAAFAAPLDSDLTKAIEMAKTTLHLNDTLWDEFQYQNYDAESGIFRLNWEQSKQENAHLSVAIDKEGHILQYIYNEPPVSQEPLATIRQSEAENNAKNFLITLYGENFAQNMRLESAPTIFPSNESYRFVFTQYINDIPLANGYITIEVGKKTGAILSLYTSENIDFAPHQYPEASQPIAKEQAMEQFLKYVGLELFYADRYIDNTVFPVYAIKNSQFAIDALSGQPVTLNAKGNVPVFDSAATAEESSSNGQYKTSLSPAELKAVQESATLFTKEAAFQKACALIGDDAADFTVKEATLNKYNNDKQYAWMIFAQKDDASLYLSVDAQNGTLLSYHYSAKNNSETAQVNNEEALKAMDQFVEKAAGDSLKDMQAKEATSYAQTWQKQYTRLVNGIPYPENGIYVAYNTALGRVTDYTFNWDDSQVFPSIAQALAPMDVLKALDNNTGYQLYYTNYNDEKHLIYDFTQKNTYIDPFKGEWISRFGEPIQEEYPTAYIWQGNNAYQETAEILRENGIYLNRSTIDAQSNVTQKDFFTLLYRAKHPYSTINDETFYQQLIKDGLLLEKEAAPTKALTYDECALYMARALGYTELLDYPQLFNAGDAQEAAFKIAQTVGTIPSQGEKDKNVPLGDAFYLISQFVRL